MTKSTGNINWMQHSTPLWVLLLIMSVFSSCTVRKGVQASLEIPVSKQLNPSKAVNNQQSLCLYTEVGADPIVLGANTNSATGNLLQPDSIFSLPKIQFFRFGQATASGWPLTLKIGYYILFRQMKSWIPSQV